MHCQTQKKKGIFNVNGNDLGDGAFPCSTCRKRKKECIFPEKPYKRGPTRGKYL